MKKFVVLSVVALLMTLKSLAAEVQVYYYYSLFNDIEKKPYIETYLAFMGSSLKFMDVGEEQQAEVEITMLFTQDGQVKSFNKYNLKSPKMKKGDTPPNFIDQQRIQLAPGIYNFEIRIKDINQPEAKEKVFLDVFTAGIEKGYIGFSGIQYIESYKATETPGIFSKNGFDLFPYVHDFFPASMKKLTVYMEIYNTDTLLANDSVFLVKYGIERVSDLQYVDSYTRIKKMKTSAIIPILAEYNIEGLPSGNYHFRVDVIDKNNKNLATKRSYFQRSNPQGGISIETPENLDGLIIENTFIEKVNSLDTLNDFLKCILPISSDREKSVITDVIKNTDTTMKQVIFYSFWKSRNGLQPEAEWKLYKLKVDYVNKAFSTGIKKGYESDRGRVFLQYGEPNDLQKSNHEPTAYPYEIWQYYTLGNQRNKRFVFYNPMIVGNDFQLLHSDAIGELQDKNWERRLHERNNSMYNNDATQSDDQWGSRAGENFNK
ncbi:MAG: hypothetical protein CVU05_10010 [Bacteroidetes bacterium HGW-Bacteroidetes-21]|jgi:GWxTD domain-containing protein|nr:MAG: hypothetical protein CVU05_10010 [Bacteroidetes bacterium HGW-Bacteroidetes-21]